MNAVKVGFGRGKCTSVVPRVGGDGRDISNGRGVWCGIRKLFHFVLSLKGARKDSGNCADWNYAAQKPPIYR